MHSTSLRYMILGTGGTGGAVGSHLARAGCDVTFIARGKHLEAMRVNGLRVEKPGDSFTVKPVKAYSMDDYSAEDRPDVIFACVKGYSIDDAVEFISRIADPDTIVIPILNIYGTGGSMQEKLTGITVTDGCIYVASEIREPGVIFMNGTILRVVFGLRRSQKDHICEDTLCDVMDRLGNVQTDLNASGIVGILSDNIERDALRKFSYVSPHGACGLYYGVAAGDIQQPGEIRECFSGLVREISDIADAMGVGFGEDAVQVNLAIMDSLSSDMTTSLQRDVAAGRPSEIDGLIYEVLRMGEKYGVETPIYNKIASELLSGEGKIRNE